MGSGIAKVLIVEDSFLVALSTQDLVREQGHAVLGPISTLAAAMEFLRQQRPDVALIDIILDGQRADPLCEALDALSVPFGFVTTVPRDDDNGKWVHRPRVLKPFVDDDLRRMIDDLVVEFRGIPAAPLDERGPGEDRRGHIVFNGSDVIAPEADVPSDLAAPPAAEPSEPPPPETP